MDYYLIINSRAKYNNQVPIEKCEIKLDIHFTNKEGKINLDYRFEKK
jgi:hypothetical protein